MHTVIASNAVAMKLISRVALASRRCWWRSQFLNLIKELRRFPLSFVTRSTRGASQSAEILKRFINFSCVAGKFLNNMCRAQMP